MTDTIDQLLDETRRKDWRELSEQQLLDIDFDTSDPESLDRLCIEVVDEPNPEVETAYDMRARGRMVRCCYCKHDNHFIGIVVAYPSGRRNLVGRDCAVKHHGADFSVLLRDFDAARDRQDYVKRKRKLLAYRSAILQGIEDLKIHPAVFTFDGVRDAWKLYLPDWTWSGLARTAGGDGILKLTKEVRDTVAERRRDEQLGIVTKEHRKRARRAGEREPIWTYETEERGQLWGAGFFAFGTKIATRLDEIGEALRETIWSLGKNDLKVTDIKAALNRLTDIRHQLEREHERLEAFPDAMRPENVLRIVDWANAHQPEEPLRLEWKPGELTVHQQRGWIGTHTLLIPSYYEAPERDLVAKIREATAIDARD